MSPSREYPERPIVGVGAVIVDEGKVVLIRRTHEPLQGQWSLPGGMVEIGETLEAALMREMAEETGLTVNVGPVIEVFDRIMRDERSRGERDHAERKKGAIHPAKLRRRAGWGSPTYLRYTCVP